MTPFLSQVAHAYATRESDNLYRYCFVFPNKRSAAFFRHYLEKCVTRGTMMPAITTISEFVSDLSPLTEANRYEQLFTLYDEYRKQPDVEVDFNRFVFWGDMLINDFNDVDRYLVDPKSIFINIKRLREISSNYLTEKQISVIKRFWGIQLPLNDPEHLWNHIEYADRPAAKSKFVKLWQVLLPLYESYTERLREKGLATQGMLYRHAAESLASDKDADIPYDRCIFVGFNVLTTAEHKIFSRLQMRRRADFYWDFDSPMAKMPHNRPGRFISRNMRDYPSLYPLGDASCDHIPHTEILAVASQIGQTKVAGRQISEWLENGSIHDASNAINTAVVLPDESLFIPMIHSVPEGIKAINVTMGFPIRYTPVASVINTITSLQLRSHRRSADGEISYFYEDVESLLTTPGIKNAAPENVSRLTDIILRQRMFNIPASLIVETAPELTPVFAPISDIEDIGCVAEYIRALCRFMLDGIKESDKMQRCFIEAYMQAVDKLYDAAVEFGVNMNGNSFFRLIERAVTSDSVNFSGEPLKGLQIMGVLETRALDFDNVIMLSMNERVFPRKHYTRSFIPDALRKDYGMATIDYQESIFAYYFYRLMSRAQNATLIYDSRRVGGSRNSGISRYPAQMLYMFGNRDVVHRNMLYPQRIFQNKNVSVKKDSRIMSLLEEFTRTGGRNLSASSINTYINCPLCFYLQHVERYNVPDDITDYMDASTYGTIFHDVAQRFYDSFKHGDPEARPEITASMLEPFVRKNNTTVEKLIVEAINRHYHRLPDDRCHEPLVGESLVLGKVLKESMLAVIRADIRECPIIYVGSETEMSAQLSITPELNINIRQIVDRIDIAGGSMRFIDYKTGGDHITSPSMEHLFRTGYDNRAKAILQLLLYCQVYHNFSGDDEPIKPLVYRLRSIAPKGIEPLKVNRQPINDYHDFEDEFMSLFRDKIAEIFDPETPFTQSGSAKACTFCKFKSICNEEDTSES